MHPDIKAFLSKPVVPKVICMLLAVLIVWQVVASALSLYNLYAKEEHTQPPISPQTVKVNQTAKADESPIFGDYVPEDIDDANIKKSMLNLSIVGVIYAENEEDSQVLIRLADGKENVYQIGDMLPGGGTIKRITPLGVVVSRNGTLESLSLPKDELIFAPPVNQPLFEE